MDTHVSQDLAVFVHESRDVLNKTHLTELTLDWLAKNRLAELTSFKRFTLCEM